MVAASSQPSSAPFEGWPSVINALCEGEDLTADRAGRALTQIFEGDVPNEQIAAFLIGLRAKGETRVEIAALSEVMMAAAAPLELPDGVVDIVGTGGSTTLRDRAFNVSTVASFVAAGAGAKVCKHGNRKASSTSGSTDLLEQLGIKVDLDGEAVARSVAEAGAGFCFARSFHPAMAKVGPTRAALGVPTIFNILGPISHPGRVDRQVLGVSDARRVDVLAEVLATRGTPHSMVVRGNDGLDELTTTTTSRAIVIRGSEREEIEINPTLLGLAPATLDDIAVGDPQRNAEVARSILAGEQSSHRDIVLLNAAAALVVADLAPDLAEGVAMAAHSIDSGHASAVLDAVVKIT